MFPAATPGAPNIYPPAHPPAAAPPYRPSWEPSLVSDLFPIARLAPRANLVFHPPLPRAICAPTLNAPTIFCFQLRRFGGDGLTLRDELLRLELTELVEREGDGFRFRIVVWFRFREALLRDRTESCRRFRGLVFFCVRAMFWASCLYVYVHKQTLMFIF